MLKTQYAIKKNDNANNALLKKTPDIVVSITTVINVAIICETTVMHCFVLHRVVAFHACKLVNSNFFQNIRGNRI